ncbi:hypothetical protein CHS0354_026005 [Potamilus streckersoni]|uniref:Fucosyltransferase n=1 Tax=Potamilus streckersoni TaxID=2493646 RepID=A0AAE0RY70_9BIVA|nr:hypothetical protein CHS0354_026005 [Potamilus streckersoni]
MKRALSLFRLKPVLHRRNRLCLCVFLLVMLTVFVRFLMILSEVHETVPEQDRGQFVQYYPLHSTQNGRPLIKIKKILIWTKFFGTVPDVFAEQERSCVSDCGYKCSLVSDKRELNSSDAIMFHLYDSWPENWVLGTRKLVDLPNYRDPSQVWVLANMEPLGNLWGDFSVFNALINWTLWYRRDATIVHPYGEVYELQPEDKSKGNTIVNYYRQKSKMAAVRISNCADYARRYRVVKELQKYIDIDTYGTCFKNVCGARTDNPYDEECHDKMTEYRFYLAFENSFCRDYITEKYWLSISRQQIPIVNWKHVDPASVLPHSYINVYDFPNLREAAKYIKEVNENETLYNSYFKWKETHIPGGKCMSCQVCRALNERPFGPQLYTNFSGWVYNDYCESVNKYNIWKKNFDRLFFHFINMFF